MIRSNRARAIEPERQNLRQDLSFVGDSGAEHVVERRDAVGGHDEQLLAEVVKISDLALSIGRAAVQGGLENRRGQRQKVPRSGVWESYRGITGLTTTTCRGGIVEG